ncbi:methyltransferase domain-containing protein [Candidatus Woesearchaeota archaeon]|nr:methyltransferase domain-containing protein [Candidatus Woesearchaeota archaeon]
MDLTATANKDYFEYRMQEMEPIIDFLKNKICLKGEKLISVGCGTAPEISMLDYDFSEKIGIDLNQKAIEFCKNQNKHAEFYCMHAIEYLEKEKADSVDCILGMDIDLNIFPDALIEQSFKVLKKNGSIILTERKDNLKIYGSYLLLPIIQRIEKENNCDILAFQFPNERDSLLVILQKK